MAALTASLLALSALGTYASQRKQGEYTSGALDVNAGLADQNATDAIARGREASARAGLATRGLLGAQRVAGASQGVDVNSGSLADIQTDTQQMSELDRLQIEHNAAREAFGYKADAANMRAQGEQVRSASRNAARGTLLTAASNLWAMKPQSAAAPKKWEGFTIGKT
jgi:hypothetical protein